MNCIYRLFCVLLPSCMALSCVSDRQPSGIWQAADDRLLTPWSEEVSPDQPYPEYPRPQMVRDEWLNLNGLWDYAIIPADQPEPDSWDGQILVPYPVESALSGVGRKVGAENRLWYRRVFELPGTREGLTIMLHFGAVDWHATVWVNGQEAGQHKGGYDAFSFDITDALKEEGEQEITLAVWDPVDEGTQPRGKQVTQPGGIWYTSVTGIWQTVWLEPLSRAHITGFKLFPDPDNSRFILDPSFSVAETDIGLLAELYQEGEKIAETEIDNGLLILPVPDPELWSPAHPFLYDITLLLRDETGQTVDRVRTYAGMRKISLGKDDKGLTRMMLNNQFVFQFGPLDQGWWPDGLYTAPADEALKYDVEMTKKMGFNMARKHVKIEPARWYYWCDKLGLLVWQDMPSGDEYIGHNDPDLKRTEESDRQFRHELSRMVEGCFNHPSIIMWVPFNEGWGQYATADVVGLIRGLDSTRLINPSSGWADRKVGDIRDIHSYPGPAMPEPEEKRAIVLGEFGGLGLPVEGHTWVDKGNWGYRSYSTEDQLMEAYTGLIRKLMPMIDKGLSAAVYTQTSDVEVEVNGLMTYDRKVVKFEPEKMRRINMGYLPPLIEAGAGIFLESTEVRITNAFRDATIRYTLDGSEPGSESETYTNAVTLDKTTTIRARSYWEDGTSSPVTSLKVEKVALRTGADLHNPEPGLSFSYYERKEDGRWNRVPDFEELEPDKSGVTERCDLSLSEREQHFAMLFEGFIKVPQDGIYTFYTNSDDGSRLLIDRKLVVDNDYTHGMVEVSGKIALSAGYYPLRLEFFQGGGGSGLEVGFEGPGTSRQILDEGYLYHQPEGGS